MNEDIQESPPTAEPHPTPAALVEGEAGSADGSSPTTAARRRRRRRGGRGRSRNPGARAEATHPATPVTTPDADGSLDAAAGTEPGDGGSEGGPRDAARARSVTPSRRRAPRPLVDRTADGSPGEPTAFEGEPAQTGPSDVDPLGDGTATARRRRRRRGGRGRSGARPAVVGDGDDAEGTGGGGTGRGEPETSPDTDAATRTDGAKPAVRRAPRPRPQRPSAAEEPPEAQADPTAPSSRRARRPAPKEGAAEATAAAAQAPAEGGAEPARRRRTRRKPATGESAGGEIGIETGAGSGDVPADEGAVPTEPAARATRTRTRRTRGSEAAEGEPTRTRRRIPGTRRRRDAVVPVERVANKVMLITEHGERDQIAVLQDRLLVEHYITRSGAKSMVGNIYLAKVQNVLPGMEAAFVDVGRGRNAVLYAGEVAFDEEIDGPRPRIEHVLKSGQTVMVQITKDPIGGKGARVSMEISLPGRYLVFVPSSQVFGISRRLPDDERQRLKKILKDVKPDSDGLIVRTAADGASAEDLRADLERLTEGWAAIEKSGKKGRAPRVLYEEPELTVRVVRDLFTEGEFKEIVTDSPEVFEKIRAYLQGVAPELVEQVRMHEGPLPMLETHHVVEQIHKALDRKVWLPSGGYLVIDKTEAMTVIDVNTGKHVGKANLEETVTKTNIEAADEVARQLRLRDIGGIIIIDFIDMLLEKNRRKVEETLEQAMAQDKTKAQVFPPIGPLGLLQVTRKRVSAGLLESFSQTCPTCEGRGILLTHKL